MPSRRSFFSHPEYRPDLDGLRAVAVLSVVAFHAFPGLAEAGFIGVDIFFVISGYLISSIIFVNLNRGTFSFAEFYAHRVRRIFPALILVVAASYLFGWFALLAAEYAQLGRHVGASGVFLSNIVLWGEAGYFDVASESKPLLHLWSLGIEEQFYIVWPLMLWMAWRRRFTYLFITLVALLASYSLNMEYLKNDAISAFYMPQSRFWELLCGAFLAWAAIYKNWSCRIIEVNCRNRISSALGRPKSTVGSGLFASAVSILAASLLIFGYWKINRNIGYPGKITLLPVLATMLFIYSGPGAWINRVLLSNRMAVWFGLISYPLYLWHWPILSYLRIIEGEMPDVFVRIAAVAVSIILAWITCRQLERPIRSGKFGKPAVLLLVLLMVLLSCVGYATYLKDGLSNRESVRVIEQMRKDKIEPGITRASDGSCRRLLDFDTPNGVVCLANSGTPEVLIVGDSHAMALNSAAYSGKVGLKTLLIGAHGCVPLPGYIVLDGSAPREGCESLVNQVLATVARVKTIKTVVIATRGPFYFTGEGYGFEGKNNFSIVAAGGKAGSQAEMFGNGYGEFVNKFLSSDKRVVFFVDVPELGEDPSGCLFKRPFLISKKPLSDCSQGRDKVILRQGVYRELIQKIKSENPSVDIYDSLNVLCDSVKCYGIRDGRLLYWDDDHISLSGSQIVLEHMLNGGLLR